MRLALQIRQTVQPSRNFLSWGGDGQAEALSAHLQCLDETVKSLQAKPKLRA